MNTAVPALAFPRATDRVHPRCVAALMSAGSVAAAGTLQLTGLHWGKKELVHTVPQQYRHAARGVAVLASIPPLRRGLPAQRPVRIHLPQTPGRWWRWSPPDSRRSGRVQRLSQ